jgi:hypothetical protein
MRNISTFKEGEGGATFSSYSKKTPFELKTSASDYIFSTSFRTSYRPPPLPIKFDRFVFKITALSPLNS